MTPSRSCFSTLNVPDAASISSDMDYFTLTAQPRTKIWREAGLPDTITAPIIYTALREPLIVAEVTLTANWEFEWDQAGLVIFAGGPPCEDWQAYHYSQTPCRRWVTAGVEYTSGEVHVSSTAAIAAHGADRALVSLPTLDRHYTRLSSAMPSVRVKVERMGDALWIWYQPRQPYCHTEASSEWNKIREISGFFWGIDSKNGVWIGCYAGRPMQLTADTTIQGQAENDRNGLWVEFEDLEIV